MAAMTDGHPSLFSYRLITSRPVVQAVRDAYLFRESAGKNTPTSAVVLFNGIGAVKINSLHVRQASLQNCSQIIGG